MKKFNFFDYHGPIFLEDLLKNLNGKFIQSKIPKQNLYIKDIKNIEDADDGDLIFLNNRKYSKYLKSSKATLCIAPEDIEQDDISDNLSLILCKNPYLEYSKAINILYSSKKNSNKNFADNYQEISIGNNVVIEENVKLGKNIVIDHNVIIKSGCVIGDGSYIGSSSYIANSIIGKNVIIHPGVKIGTDGFGFATEKGIHHKIFHIGIVEIGDNVEIGANSTIDRGSIKNTIIGEGTIIDNLVQIGHNVVIGRSCVIVAQVGIAGSTIIGDYSVIGGQVGIAGHLKIGKNVQIAAKSGVLSNIEDNSVVGGYPSIPIRQWHKQTIILRKMLDK